MNEYESLHERSAAERARVYLDVLNDEQLSILDDLLEQVRPLRPFPNEQLDELLSKLSEFRGEQKQTGGLVAASS